MNNKQKRTIQKDLLNAVNGFKRLGAKLNPDVDVNELFEPLITLVTNHEIFKIEGEEKSVAEMSTWDFLQKDIEEGYIDVDNGDFDRDNTIRLIYVKRLLEKSKAILQEVEIEEGVDFTEACDLIDEVQDEITSYTNDEEVNEDEGDDRYED